MMVTRLLEKLARWRPLPLTLAEPGTTMTPEEQNKLLETLRRTEAERARLHARVLELTEMYVEMERQAGEARHALSKAYPERAAIEFFWDKLSPGAPVVLDDYAWEDYSEQKAALDDFAHTRGVEILTLPTGQGLLLKPWA